MKKNNSNNIGISLIIHTKNEEKNIKDCILSAKRIVNEILVIDMSSSDKTADIAKRMGALVFVISDSDFVDNCRNFGFSKARFNWILSLDADERLTVSLADQLLRIITENSYDVVMIPFKNIRFGKWMRHTGFWPDYHPRFFKKGYVKFPKNIKQPHVPQKISGRVLTLGADECNAIVHYNVENLSHMLAKFTRYVEVKGGGDFFEKNKINPQVLINYYENEFRWRYIDQQGYLDGMAGFVSSKFREFFKFTEFVKWWEKQGYTDIVDEKELQKIVLKEYRLKGDKSMYQKIKLFVNNLFQAF